MLATGWPCSGAHTGKTGHDRMAIHYLYEAFITDIASDDDDDDDDYFATNVPSSHATATTMKMMVAAAAVAGTQGDEWLESLESSSIGGDGDGSGSRRRGGNLTMKERIMQEHRAAIAAAAAREQQLQIQLDVARAEVSIRTLPQCTCNATHYAKGGKWNGEIASRRLCSCTFCCFVVMAVNSES